MYIHTCMCVCSYGYIFNIILCCTYLFFVNIHFTLFTLDMLITSDACTLKTISYWRKACVTSNEKLNNYPVLLMFRYKAIHIMHYSCI